MKKVVLGVLFTLIAIGMQAQTKKWTLVECVEYAIQNNITVEQFAVSYTHLTLPTTSRV